MASWYKQYQHTAPLMVLFSRMLVSFNDCGENLLERNKCMCHISRLYDNSSTLFQGDFWSKKNQETMVIMLILLLYLVIFIIWLIIDKYYLVNMHKYSYVKNLLYSSLQFKLYTHMQAHMYACTFSMCKSSIIDMMCYTVACNFGLCKWANEHTRYARDARHKHLLELPHYTYTCMMQLQVQ